MTCTIYILTSEGEKYVHLKTSEETTLGMFLLILLCFKSPEPLLNEHIIKEYIKKGLSDIAFNVIEP